MALGWYLLVRAGPGGGMSPGATPNYNNLAPGQVFVAEPEKKGMQQSADLISGRLRLQNEPNSATNHGRTLGIELTCEDLMYEYE